MSLVLDASPPSHKRNIWVFPQLPQLICKEREATANEQSFKHIDRPSNGVDRNIKDPMASLVHMFEPHWAEKPRASENIGGILGF